MKPNRIQGFEEALVILTISILLITLVSDFYSAFLSYPLPGEIALYRRIGKWLIAVLNVLSTWPCFFAGLLCGLAFTRRPLLYAALAVAPTAAAPAFANGPALTVISNILFALGFSYFGAKIGIGFKHNHRIPASYVPDGTGFSRLVLRGLVSLAVALLTIAVAALLHNVLIGRDTLHTASALAFYSACLAILSMLRFAIRSHTVANEDPGDTGMDSSHKPENAL